MLVLTPAPGLVSEELLQAQATSSCAFAATDSPLPSTPSSLPTAMAWA